MWDLIINHCGFNQDDINTTDGMDDDDDVKKKIEELTNLGTQEIVFVIGSISGSTICYNIGKKVAAKLKEDSAESAQTKEIQQPVEKSINIKS